MKRNVYLAMGHDVGGNTGNIVLGVFSSREAAVAAVEHAATGVLSVSNRDVLVFEGWDGNDAKVRHPDGYYLGLWIEEWEVDGEMKSAGNDE